jgi:RNA polymerase sigma factor (sigma-70 family)
VSSDQRVEDLLRELTPPVLGALTRRFGSFDLCEDALQEALLDAATQWPRAGLPDNPRGWLITTASRRFTDLVRADSARRRREQRTASLEAPVLAETAGVAGAAGDRDRDRDRDDSLLLLFLCCHPALTAASQIALTLRSVGGLTTAQIAAAFLVPEATMAQRISRGKQRLRAAGATFELPAPADRPARLAAVLHVLYLIFNEGYAATSGPRLISTDLTTEAIRLTRELHRLLPEDGEVAGLLALMLLTEARRLARVAPDGALIPLAEQDRGTWDQDFIHEGVALVSHALTHADLGQYQLQAAIAAVHDEALDAPSTDWAQILGLYALLESIAPNPMVTLNRAIALAMVRGPRAGLRLLESLDSDERLARHHRLPAVRAHLLELDGDPDAAREAYLTAARATTSGPEQRYLQTRAALLARPAR